MNPTIQFADGYTVTINEGGLVTWTLNKKTQSCHSTHFGPVPPNSKAAAFLQKNNKVNDDYIFANPGLQEMLLRATNGVREAVAAAAFAAKEAQAALDAKRKADHAAAMAASKQACGLQDPVLVQIEYFDGYPFNLVIEDRKIDPKDWSKVTTFDNFSWIERTHLDKLILAHDTEVQRKANKKAQEQLAAKDFLESKKAEAIASGHPVVLNKWTTDQCTRKRPDCSFDNATKYVHPDGSTTVEYTCCY